MTDTSPLRLYGTHASPYTRKMLALLRYRRIPYQLLQGDQGTRPPDLPRPRVALLPTFYLNNAEGELEALVDSTPVIRRLEKEFDSRPVIPTDPVVAFVDYLLEDYSDEWMTKAMFHFRWAFEADADKASTILPLEHNPSLAQEDCEALQQGFRERQVSRLHVVGSNDITAEVIENTYVDFLLAFEQLLTQRPFLLGQRPAASDFALYGQLTQLAGFDPTSMALTLTHAPRVFAWVNHMEDLSGLEVGDSDWIERQQMSSLKPVLTEVGRSYAPVMLANAKALDSGEQTVQTHVDGKPWQQQPFPYQKRCLQWLRQKYVKLDENDRQWIDELLEGTGCEALLQD